MRITFLIGFGLMVSLAAGQTPKVRSRVVQRTRVTQTTTINNHSYSPEQTSDIFHAWSILDQAELVARTIPDDPPRPAGIPRAYYDPPYGPEERENTLAGIAKAEIDAGNLVAAQRIGGTLGPGRARDSVVESGYVVAGTTGSAKFALEILSRGRLPEEKRQSLLYQIGLARARAGDAKGALEFAGALTNAAAKSPLLDAIAIAQAKAGDVAGAFKTRAAIVHSERDANGPLDSFLAIGVALAKSGDRVGAETTFKKAREFASANPRFALGQVAQAQADAGELKEALETARSIPFDPPRNVALAALAGTQAQAGDVKGAFEIAQAIQGEDNEYWKASALGRIAKAQAARGDQAGAAGTFQNAIQAAMSIKDVVQTVHGPQGESATAVLSMADTRAKLLAQIAQAQAEAGEKGASRATFEQATKQARSAADPHPEGGMTLYLVAKAQARAGFVKEALENAVAIQTPKGMSRGDGWYDFGAYQSGAFSEIAQAQGLRAEPPEELGWIDTLKSPSQKASALLGFAKGLLERAGAVPPEEKLPGEI